ncbi:hypothetical protein JOC85_001810 [Bacillus mesophilus]|uniref:Uncharacterized protein n=1 Tax=Bacillus mesophilus TaxID=1808955 RepID=A0A6M0Q5A1_9BACI|nr:hypothetical protein [Bacillus mesophilus]MBM7661038.1 hypothetical protein [Bacillus mesophilus]NEY71424.1 hypothetical protein [Bacillus mesophilus]
MKKRKTPWKFILLFLLIFTGFILLIGFRFTADSALPNDTKIIESIPTVYGKAILYEDTNNHTFGLAEIHRSGGFMYHYAGGTYDYYIEGNEPFKAAGFGSDVEDGFMVGIRIKDPNIKHIVIGNHLENLTPSDEYEFNIETVKKHPTRYHIKEVVNQHVLFVLDEYSEFTWTIRALDQDGNLISDKLFGMSEARYVDW